MGTKHPDEAQLDAAYHLAFALASIGNHIVRTLAEYGIDQRVMDGTGGRNLEVHVPWASYNRSIIPPLANIVIGCPINNIVYDSEALIIFYDENDIELDQIVRLANSLNVLVIRGDKGSILDYPRWLGKTLQRLGLASKDLAVTIQRR